MFTIEIFLTSIHVSPLAHFIVGMSRLNLYQWLYFKPKSWRIVVRALYNVLNAILYVGIRFH